MVTLYDHVIEEQYFEKVPYPSKTDLGKCHF